MIELVCIGCPRGCHLQVDENNDYAVTGNHCPIGAEYGKNELLNPTRVLTTTVKITGAIHHMLPVKSAKPLPKAKLIEAAKSLATVTVASPIRVGDVVVADILGTGVDIVAAKNM